MLPAIYISVTVEGRVSGSLTIIFASSCTGGFGIQETKTNESITTSENNKYFFPFVIFSTYII